MSKAKKRSWEAAMKLRTLDEETRVFIKLKGLLSRNRKSFYRIELKKSGQVQDNSLLIIIVKFVPGRFC